MLTYMGLADKMDLTAFGSILSYTHLKSVTIFDCLLKRGDSCVMHSSIPYLLNLQLIYAKIA